MSDDSASSEPVEIHRWNVSPTWNGKHLTQPNTSVQSSPNDSTPRKIQTNQISNCVKTKPWAKDDLTLFSKKSLNKFDDPVASGPLLAWVEGSKKVNTIEKKKKKKFRGKHVEQWLECSKKKNPPLLLNISLDAALVEQAIDTLREGTTLWKVKSFSSWHRRRYVFDRENKRIIYEGSRKLPCLPATETIDITDIHDIRKGWKTDRFNKIAFKVAREKQKKPDKSSIMEELCCFSVVHGPDHRTLDLVCPDENVCNAWVRGLSHLIALQRSIERDQAFNTWLKDQFRKADLDKSGALNFNECMTLLHQINIEMNESHARILFDEANTNKKKLNDEDVIDEQEFVTFYKLLKKRPELEDLFNRYSVGAAVWGPNQLIAFLENEQKMTDISVDDAIDIIDVYEPTEAKADGFFSLDGFRKMLLSPLMDIFNVSHRTVYQDMKQPLSHYYIASSHNTYLMADQIAGESSVEGYITALKNGCRCVELDLWDGPDGEPVIYHGYTLTSKIRLKDVLQDALKQYAFATSEYPVILSLENHLSIEQQEVLAKLMKTILGDMLYTSPVSPNMTELPSPTYLKKKIIVKAKKLPDIHNLTVPMNEEEVSSASDDESFGNEEEKAKAKKLSPALSDLVNICTAVHFKDFDHSAKSGKVQHISSLSENKALRLASLATDEFIDHNRRQLTRIYPGAIRQNSSNYDPIPFWNVGCQIVALNYQTKDFAMMLNDAMFQNNGQCGYVLKPETFRKGTKASGFVVKKKLKTVHLKIISGQCIPKPRQSTEGEIIDPYVVISVLGHADDQRTFRTKHVHNNGFNPTWNESFKIELKMPDLAFLHFIVRDYSSLGKDEKLGEYCLPFSCVQQGYRHVHLRDEFNRPMIPASIFVYVEFS